MDSCTYILSLLWTVEHYEFVVIINVQKLSCRNSTTYYIKGSHVEKQLRCTLKLFPIVWGHNRKKWRIQYLLISTNPLGSESRVSPKLVKTMSSGVPVPSLGHLFSKLEYWRPFEALARKCKNTTPMWTNIKYSFAWLTGMWKLIFYDNNFFGSGLFFDPWYLKKDWKMARRNFFF